MKVVRETGLSSLVACFMKTKYNRGAYIVWYLDDSEDITWDAIIIIKLTEKEVPNIRNESESPLDYISLKRGQGELFINGKCIKQTEVR